MTQPGLLFWEQALDPDLEWAGLACSASTGLKKCRATIFLVLVKIIVKSAALCHASTVG